MAGLDQAEDCPQRLRDALRWAIRLFAAHQADTPRLDAELLLAHVTELERVQLLTRWNDCLTDTQVGQFSALVRRALADEPIAYLVGERAFYDITVEVNPAVLIPRHETEHIVEQALVWAAGHPGPVRIIDVGTGSGALAIVLARHLSSAQVWATDVSPAALAVAQQNARRYGLAERIRFQESDLLGAIDGRWDLIVANLPYVDQDELPQLQPSVRQYEPRIALDGGRGGTLVIERLIAQLPERLACPGLALLECDPRQAPALAEAARQALPRASVDLRQDLAGWDRLVRIELGEGHGPQCHAGAEETTVLAVQDRATVTRAVSVIKRGGLIVLPTDTVYGVGCDMRSEPALTRLYAAKDRPRNMPIPVLVADPDDARQVAESLPDAFPSLAQRFWPGALTLIVPRRPDLPPILTAGGDTVAVRLPDHQEARAIIRAAGGALAVTSANRSGRPAPATAEEALEDLRGRVQLVIDGGRCPGGRPSSIVDLTGEHPRLLRLGALDVEQLREVLPDLEA